MKKIILGCCLTAISLPLFAMPCDTGYVCATESNKIKIELSSCRYKNSLKLTGLTIDKKAIHDMTLASGFDGLPLNGKVLAFQLVSTDKKNPVSFLVETMSETSNAKSSGTLTRLKMNNTEPAAPLLVSTEAINCSSAG